MKIIWEFTSFRVKPYLLGINLLIVEGPFEGYEATLFSQKSDDRVIVLLKIAEKFVKVKLRKSTY